MKIESGFLHRLGSHSSDNAKLLTELVEILVDGNQLFTLGIRETQSCPAEIDYRLNELIDPTGNYSKAFTTVLRTLLLVFFRKAPADMKNNTVLTFTLVIIGFKVLLPECSVKSCCNLKNRMILADFLASCCSSCYEDSTCRSYSNRLLLFFFYREVLLHVFIKEFLGLSRNEVAVQAGILTSTFLSNFKKHKIPMFADLFRIAATLGMPIDTLLYGYKCKNESYEDPNNILYWIMKSGGSPAASSLLMHCSDKTAICKTLQILNDNCSKGVLSNPLICETYDDLCLNVFISFLRAEEVDDIHIYNCAMKILAEEYVSRYNALQPLGKLLMAMQKLENCLWDYMHLPVEDLWKEIDKKVKNSTVYSNKTKFLNDSVINSRTYSDYCDATRTKSSLSTETVWKICALLNFANLDTRICSHLPEIGTHLENSTITNLIMTYEIQNEVFKENLKSLPFLAQYFDAIFSLDYGGLNQINRIAAGARVSPYSNMMYSTERTRPHYFSCFYDEDAREVEYAYGTDFARDKMHNSYGLESEDGDMKADDNLIKADTTIRNSDFNEILTIIYSSQARALASVNRELIAMYWEIGKIVSEKTATDGWGKSTISSLVSFLQTNFPSSNGFSDKNIWRIKQFYATYKNNEKLSPLVREISWTNNLLIMTACKTDKAKEFYLKACIKTIIQRGSLSVRLTVCSISVLRYQM